MHTMYTRVFGSDFGVFRTVLVLCRLLQVRSFLFLAFLPWEALKDMAKFLASVIFSDDVSWL